MKSNAWFMFLMYFSALICVEAKVLLIEHLYHDEMLVNLHFGFEFDYH